VFFDDALFPACLGRVTIVVSLLNVRDPSSPSFGHGREEGSEAVSPVAIVWPCPLTVDAYAAAGGDVEFPRPPCPSCAGRLVFWSDRGDHEEAARQYQRSLDVKERLGDQAGMASGYHQLGVLAQDRGDHEEAARQYQRSLDIKERLGNQAGMASSYSQLGLLEEASGGQIATAITWHVRALAIRLALRAPQALIDLRRLSEHRRELGTGQFTTLLNSTSGDPDLADTITALIDQLDKSGTGDS
jgi:tetratricopeptide (TPR) repeat protein